MKRIMKRIITSSKAKLTAFAVVASTTVINAAPVTVDLADAETSISNAGGAMIGIAVIMLGFALVIGFLKRR